MASLVVAMNEDFGGVCWPPLLLAGRHADELLSQSSSFNLASFWLGLAEITKILHRHSRTINVKVGKSSILILGGDILSPLLDLFTILVWFGSRALAELAPNHLLLCSLP